MNVLLSVIIPVYNLEKYIDKCLDSLLVQTYSNLEIIVVNDGSTDKSLSILNEYKKKDSRIQIIDKQNEGVSKARLDGMKRATGQYIGFVDGDDIVEEDMFELLMNNAIKYNADISHCGYSMDFPNGHSDKYYGTDRIVIQNNKEGLKDLLEGKFIEPGLWNKIYKKSLIEDFIENKDMDYSIKNLEDLLVNYFLFKQSNLSIYEDKCKYHYTIRKGSAATKKSRNKYEDPLKVIKRIMHLEKKYSDVYKIIYKRYIYVLIYNANQNDYEDIQKNARKKLKEEIKHFKENKLSTKLKLMSIGTCYLNLLYKLVRVIYNKITHVDKKYDV